MAQTHVHISIQNSDITHAHGCADAHKDTIYQGILKETNIGTGRVNEIAIILKQSHCKPLTKSNFKVGAKMKITFGLN